MKRSRCKAKVMLRIDSPVIERKPYLFIGAMSSGFSDTVPVKLTAGRMPQNSNERCCPKAIFTPAHLQ